MSWPQHLPFNSTLISVADVDLTIGIYEDIGKIDRDWLARLPPLEHLVPKFPAENIPADRLSWVYSLDTGDIRAVRRQCGDPLTRISDLVWSFFCTARANGQQALFGKIARRFSFGEEAVQLESSLVEKWNSQITLLGFWKTLSPEERELFLNWWRCYAKRPDHVLQHPDADKISQHLKTAMDALKSSLEADANDTYWSANNRFMINSLADALQLREDERYREKIAEAQRYCAREEARAKGRYDFSDDYD
jgi:hypothetical protein